MSEDSTTTSRTLRLLSLLQTRRAWPGRELAARLEVSGRTLRRDVERLRSLGYRVHADRGNVGGYQLAPGADLPPLILTDEEAVSLVAVLRTAAVSGPTVGTAQTGIAVLAKLEQALPRRLQRRASALRSATVTPDLPAGIDEPVIDPALLVRLAVASRDRHRIQIDYTAADGTQSARSVEPVALVPRGRRWYLVCWDLSQSDWRTLRVDRINGAHESGSSFPVRQLPARDAAAFTDQQFQAEPVHRVEVVINATVDDARRYLSGYAKNLRADGPERTRWLLEAEHWQTLVGTLVWLPWEYTVHGSPELVTTLHAAAVRMIRGCNIT